MGTRGIHVLWLAAILASVAYGGPGGTGPLQVSGDDFLRGWRSISGSLEVRLYANKDVMDLLKPADNLMDPVFYQYSYHPFVGADPVWNFTVDYRFKPIKNLNMIFYLDAKPESGGNFFSYRFDRQGYVDGQFEVNADIGDTFNVSSRVTLRKETYTVLAADSDHVGLPLSNGNIDGLARAKGDYVFSKERWDLKFVALKTLGVQPRLTLSMELNEYTYPELGPGSRTLFDPYLSYSTGLNRVSKRFFPYVDGGVTFRLANYRLTIDVGGYYHPINFAPVAGALQSTKEWSGTMDLSFFASKYLTFLAGMRVTQNTYGYEPPYQTSFFSASEADLTTPSRVSETADQRNQVVFRTYVGFRLK